MKDIEKNIKKIIDQQRQAPPGFVWENIESDLKRKRRRGVVIFGITLGVIGIFMLSQHISFDSLNNTNNLIAQSEQNISLDKSLIKSNDLVTNNISRSSTQANQSINTKIKGTKKKNNNIIFSTKSSDNRDNNSIPNNPIIEQNENDDFTIGRSSSNENVYKDVSTNKEILTTTKNKIFQEPIDPLPYMISLIRTNKLFYTLFLLNSKSDFMQRSVESINNKFNVYTEVGLLSGLHQTQINTLGENRLAGLRQRTENSWFTWGTYLHIGLRMRNNIYFGTGIEIMQSKDKFFYKEEGLTGWFAQEANVKLRANFKTGTLTQRGEIRYTMIDIPLILGYATKINNWNLGLEFSSNVNVYFKSSGQSLTQNKELFHLEDKTNIYKRRVGLGLTGSLVIGRQLSNGYSWLIKPTFKTYLGNITQQSYDLDITYRSLYLNAGIVRNF